MFFLVIPQIVILNKTNIKNIYYIINLLLLLNTFICESPSPELQNHIISSSLKCFEQTNELVLSSISLFGIAFFHLSKSVFL